jgi:hypothetical protein
MLPLLASLSVGFGFSVPSGAKECFEEHAAEGEHVLGTWSVKHEEATPPTLSGWKVTGQLMASASRDARELRGVALALRRLTPCFPFSHVRHSNKRRCPGSVLE